MAIVTPTDRPKSVRNWCVIEVFGGVFVLSRCFLDFSVVVGAFVTGLSQISSFSLYIQGWTGGQTGPAFLDLQIITGVSIDRGSAFFTASGLGYLTGSLLNGYIYDKVRHKIVLVFASLCGLGIVTAIIPWVSVYEVMVLMYFLFGVSGGFLDTSKKFK